MPGCFWAVRAVPSTCSKGLTYVVLRASFTVLSASHHSQWQNYTLHNLSGQNTIFKDVKCTMSPTGSLCCPGRLWERPSWRKLGHFGAGLEVYIPACFWLWVFLICPDMSRLQQPHACCHPPTFQPRQTACPQTVCCKYSFPSFMHFIKQFEK